MLLNSVVKLLIVRIIILFLKEDLHVTAEADIGFAVFFSMLKYLVFYFVISVIFSTERWSCF